MLTVWGACGAEEHVILWRCRANATEAKMLPVIIMREKLCLLRREKFPKVGDMQWVVKSVILMEELVLSTSRDDFRG